MRTFDDFALGDEMELGSAEFELDEMLSFARRWDPQSFHVDPEAARESAFGGVIASGRQTLCAMSKLLTDRIIAEEWVNLGGTGMDGIRLRVPVRAGDVLTARATVVEHEPSRSGKPRGRLGVRIAFVNQRREDVGEMTASLLLGRTPNHP
jgi:acyl dehydratase